jgi:predicted AlkP superfamily pyrophosphatase or phosphodiesterase
MINRRVFTFAAPIFFLLLAAATFATAQQAPPSVLLISFDGFRHDYIDKHDLKNFKAFRANGVSAEGLIPCYPSLTFPNHYSIVTGMRPANHGLVDNSFYDSAFNISYTIGNMAAVSDGRFYGGKPLWTLAREAGMKTASFFWVGSEIADPSRRPDITVPYDGKVSFKTRIDSVLAWLGRKDRERPRFISLYFSEPDHESHETGPNSPENIRVLQTMDSLLGYLSQGLKKIGAPVNTILVSDHGMSELVMADETFVFVDELYDVGSKKVRTVVSSTLAHLYIDDKKTLDSMYTLLKGKEDRFKVYRRNELPKQLQYGRHYRIGDLVMMANPAHNIRRSDRKTYMQRGKPGAFFGVHGFDPTMVADMRGLFLAQGPNLRKGEKLGLVRNIDIYPLVVRILGLKLPPIDGDPKALKKIYIGR